MLWLIVTCVGWVLVVGFTNVTDDGTTTGPPQCASMKPQSVNRVYLEQSHVEKWQKNSSPVSHPLQRTSSLWGRNGILQTDLVNGLSQIWVAWPTIDPTLHQKQLSQHRLQVRYSAQVGAEDTPNVRIQKRRATVVNAIIACKLRGDRKNVRPAVTQEHNCSMTVYTCV
jgi:hypothetical protein